MRKYTLLILATALVVLSVGAASGALALEPRAEDYYSRPPLMVGASKPAILLILSKDMEIYAPAYSAPADHDNDGRMDVGFNPSVVYYGIFDPWSCYTYNWKDDGVNTDHRGQGGRPGPLSGRLPPPQGDP